MGFFSCNCTCRSGCIALAAISSTIICVITAFLTITASITVTPAFLWVALGIAVGFLAILTAKSGNSTGPGVRSCVCPALTSLLVGILGTALASVVLLAITFAATSIVGAIITGLLLLFLSLILTSAACLVKCVARCGFSSDDD